MKRKWHVYVVPLNSPGREVYLWQRCWTRRGAERAAHAFTLMPAYLLPMDPVIVHDDQMDQFSSSYAITSVV